MRDRLAEELEELERQLLAPNTRADKGMIEKLLADDFIEFGSSGNVYSRDEVISMLLAEKPTDRSAFNFVAKSLSADTVLLTYQSIRAGRHRALRSSIWRNQSGQWRMMFHQGTPQP
jgi:hypothetical protein